MKKIRRFLDDIGPVAFAVLFIGTEVTAGLMLLCALLPLSGQAGLYWLGQQLGDAALRVLWGSVLLAFASCLLWPGRRG